MKYNHKGKNITIPDNEIDKYRKKYDLTKEEAIQLWLEDKDLEFNEEIEELTEKSKSISRSIHDARTVSRDKGNNEKKPREKKRDVKKETIIMQIAEYLIDLGYENVKIDNPSKIVVFSIADEDYKIDLSRKNKALAERKAKKKEGMFK